MESSIILSIVAIGLSFLSLIASAALALRQTTMMRHANQVPVLADFAQQVSSVEFQRAEEYIIGQLAGEHSPDLGVGRLPEAPRTAVTRIIWHFNTVGLLIVLGIVDERMVIPLFGYRIRRLWESLEPYIDKEREIRGDYYSAFLEDLVCRVNDHWPPSAAYKIRLKRLRPGSLIRS